jgi:tetratricopeptide (TPR) repeat protein
MKLKSLFIVVFSLSCFGIYSQNLQQTQDLADDYFENGNPENALYHFQRVAYFSKSKDNHEVIGKIADCYYALGEFEKALEYYDHAYFACHESDKKWDYLFSKISTYLETKNYQLALVELYGIETTPGSELEVRKELYLASTFFGLEEFDQASAHFQAALPDDRSEDRQKIANLFSDPGNTRRPNPKTALILSIILPGSGQLYSGDAEAALNSFLLTGAFVGLVLYLSVRIHPIEAILTGSPWFQRYYQGGFDHAEQTAIDERQRRRNQIYQETLTIISEDN